MDPESWQMSAALPHEEPLSLPQPILEAHGLFKSFGHVVGLNGADIELYPGEVLAIIGDNGAGKSTLVQVLTGALIPDAGTIRLAGQVISFKRPQDARQLGIETVYQTLALAPSLDVATNLYLGREKRRHGPVGSVLRILDWVAMRRGAKEFLKTLGIETIQNISQAVETLSGGQRQAVAVARAAAFGTKVIILDEPTAALGVRESNQVLQLIRDLRSRGLPVILISHNMPQVFALADRVMIMRLGRRVAVVTPATSSMENAVAIMTGAKQAD
jgi:fructose transport system ATP-binding protein